MHTIIRGGTIVSMDDAIGNGFVGDIHIQNDRIVQVGRNLAVDGAGEIDARGRIVFPGLIDCHRHAWQSLLRGTAGDLALGEYLVEARSLYCGCYDEDAAYIANYLGGLESIAAGITSIVDHCHLQKSYEVSDALARGLIDSGVAGVFCYALQNVPDYTKDAPFEIEHVRGMLRRLPDEWHDANAARVRDRFFTDGGLLKFGVALPEATPYLPAQLACTIVARAKALNGALITGHWNANPAPDAGPSVLSTMRDAHLLSSTVLAHCNRLDDADLSIMADHGVGLCTCPDIEAGMGLLPLLAARFVRLGGHACLGQDITSYVSADMLKQARLMLQLERYAQAAESGEMPRTVAWTAKEALELATIGGARALGMETEIGSLTPGKRADIVIAAPDPIRTAPLGDAIAALVFYTDPADIETVFVAGRLRKSQGALVDVDLADVLAKAAAARERITSRAAALSRADLAEVWAGMF